MSRSDQGEEVCHLLTPIGLVIDDLSTSGDNIYVVRHKPVAQGGCEQLG